MTRIATLVAAFGVAVTGASGAEGQAGFTCPDDSVMSSPMAVQLREMALRPGVRIDPATFLKDARVAAFVGEMTTAARARAQVDPAGLCRYRAANAAMQGNAPRVVYLGDSITENWIHADPGFFGNGVVDRGISGQTSAQILLRMYPDVVALHPGTVHIMAGTNDILQNAGPVGDEDILNNLGAMTDIARANGIAVVLSAIPPIAVRTWQPDLRPAARIAALNLRIRALAERRGAAFADYFAPLRDAGGGFDVRFANDGVHPNRDGYAVMKPIALRAIAAARGVSHE